MYKICFLSLSSQYSAWLMVVCKLVILYYLYLVSCTIVLPVIFTRTRNICTRLKTTSAGINADTLRILSNNKKEVNKQLFHARPPFRGRSVVVQCRRVLTSQPQLSPGSLWKLKMLSGTPNPAYWEEHFKPLLGVTSACPSNAVGHRFPDPPQPS